MGKHSLSSSKIMSSPSSRISPRLTFQLTSVTITYPYCSDYAPSLVKNSLSKNLNVIPDDLVPNNDIDTGIGKLTNNIKIVIKKCQTKVPANSDRRGLAADVCKLIRPKMQRYAARTHILHSIIGLEREPYEREVMAPGREFKNENCSTPIEEITPNHKAYWAVA
ncbi:hypothetical protein EVAR_40803_1 [Eumeta japonica]|uniref:Uncharacterized protein n=1 Tax=Eumeta variegata TaxID=151549 RepID=A0A4C1X480_EUMVA|nr:hypothetical protein EVAR_40803_1 [Eumeta japonica]